MAEALAKVKHRFGAHAVILSTRTCRRRGILGLVGSDYVEIMAAPDSTEFPRPLRQVWSALLQSRLCGPTP